MEIKREIKFSNDYFKAEKTNNGSTIITILKDDFEFYRINLEGCELITDSKGYIMDNFTKKSLSDMNEYLRKSNNEFKDLDNFKIELRNRMLNVLISQL